MSVRKSITLLTLLLSVLAASCVAADAAGGSAADAALRPTICDLSSFRTAVVDAKALVDKGDLAAARTRLKDLDTFWDSVAASSTPQTVARWRVVDRAIDRGLDRALLALRPHWPNQAMGDKALADLVAVVDQVSGKNQAAPMEDACDRHRPHRSVAVQPLPSLPWYNTNVYMISTCIR